MSELIAMVLATGKILDVQPQSLLLVGEPATGKSALVKRFADVQNPSLNPTVREMGNLSSWGLRNFLLHEVSRGVTHVSLPEFQTAFMRRADVWAGVEGLLLQAMAEGVGDYYNGPVPESYKGAKFGLIAAQTTESFYRVRDGLRQSGFLSRCLIVGWSRTRTEIRHAMERKMLNGDYRDLSKIPLGLPHRAVPIDIHRRVVRSILTYVKEGGDDMSRGAERFVALTKAAALRRGSGVATVRDWQAVLANEPFWNREL